MTKRDFDKIASIIAWTRQLHDVQVREKAVIEMLIQTFEMDYPNFDKQKFLKAAGLTVD